jgi:hypothetical protein
MPNWINDVKELAEIEWGTSQSAVLLSRIPDLLKLRGIDIAAELNGRKLKEAIDNEGRGTVRLVQEGLTWGVVPQESQASTEGSLFKNNSVDDINMPIPRFKRSVWAAFIKKLDENHRRFLVLSANIKFYDIAKGQTPPPQSKEIPLHSISSDITPASISSSIKRWSSEMMIPIDDLLESTSPITENSPDHDGGIGICFSRAFDSLSNEELRRIFVPMDIVMKLLRLR